ncbi:MAG: lipoyl(octanoyl) transferase LipB [Candidatus Aquicultor sp.]
MSEMKCLVAELGTIDYQSALDLQMNLVTMRSESKLPDVLLLLEHPHVYTVGRRFDSSHLILTEEELKMKGVKLFHSDRGGQLTYHGPGQLVGYPIIEIGGISMIRYYLRNLEEVLLRTVRAFGIDADRLPGYPGIWFGLEKLGAIGLRVSRGITKHGFALNVSTDLCYFEGIIPCGIHDKGVTSMSKLLGLEVPLELVRNLVIENFGHVFHLDMVPIPGDEILKIGFGETPIDKEYYVR